MHNRLQPIILQKQIEVAALKNRLAATPDHPVAKILQGEISVKPKKSFKAALCAPTLAVIAEIKRKSPSKGALATITDPLALAQTYIAGGANALSILTDEKFFAGHLQDLTTVAQAIEDSPVPILRKDFLIDPVQIAEAIFAGANAILLIVAVLKQDIKMMLKQARALNIDALVEVHDQEELRLALDAGAEIIGINNRDLSTFEVDIERAKKLGAQIPATIIKVAESGIAEPQIARQYAKAGFNAVLIGEALVKSSHPETFIRACQYA